MRQFFKSCHLSFCTWHWSCCISVCKQNLSRLGDGEIQSTFPNVHINWKHSIFVLVLYHSTRTCARILRFHIHFNIQWLKLPKAPSDFGLSQSSVGKSERLFRKAVGRKPASQDLLLIWTLKIGGIGNWWFHESTSGSARSKIHWLQQSY